MRLQSPLGFPSWAADTPACPTRNVNITQTHLRLHLGRRGGRSASVLIAVFWLMAALGLAVFSTAFVVHADMEVVASEKASFRAMQLAETGIAIAANSIVEEYDPILTQFPVTDPGLLEYFDFGENEGFLVKIRSESGWLNVNHALLRGDRDLIERLFNVWGMELSQAQEIVSAMIDWVDADEITTAAPEGAEAGWYEDNGFGDGNYPFNRPFYDVEEMKFVRGMDIVASYMPAWRRYFTVRSEGPIDVNEAPAELIAVAAETEVEWVEDFIFQRDGEDGIKDTEDDQPFSSVEEVLSQIQSPPDRRSITTPRFTTDGQTVRIESTGIYGDYRRKLVVILRNRGAQPALLSREEVPF
jgi:general secretion pathway protein K